MTKMELLTDRLAILVEQVAEHQIEELINKEKLQQERLIQKSQRTDMLAFHRQYQESSTEARKARRLTLASNKRGAPDATKSSSNDGQSDGSKASGGPKKMATICSIWGLGALTKNKSNKTDQSGSGGGGSSKQEEAKCDKSSKINMDKFRKAAKMTVVLNSLKQGIEVCTCEDLNTPCKVHDS